MAVNTSKCSECDKQYNSKQKEEIYTHIARRTMYALSPCPALCLDCIMIKLQKDKETCLPKLNQAIRKLRIFIKISKKIVFTKQRLSAHYSALDQHQQYIKFFLRENSAVSKKRSSSKPRASRKLNSANKQADLIAALLASMTPKQQALVAKQAAKLK